MQAGVEFVAGGTASTVQATQVFETVNVASSAVYTYADGATGRKTLTSVTKNIVTTTFGYDANGNLTSRTGGWTYERNYENLMTKAVLRGNQRQAHQAGSPR